MSLLEIRNLSVIYRTPNGPVRAVDDVSLNVEQKEHLGIIGESGCGKTTLIRALVRVLPRNGEIASGEIRFKGRNLVELSAQEMRELRWREIATVPQASMDALDPVQRVGRQLETILRVRGGRDPRAAKRRAADLFDLVGLDTGRLENYPHEFSGGMKQRAVIAMALALDPSLLIGDEPLTALDVIVQDQVLEVFKRLETELDLTVMLVTHDISVVAQVCDTVSVMYAGRVVEQAPAQPFFESPYHPYSLGLQQAFPTLVRPKEVLVSIEGYPPDLHTPPTGCRFAERCPFAQPRCYEVDPLLEDIAPDHHAACLRADEMDVLRAQALQPQTWQNTEAARQYVLNGGRMAQSSQTETAVRATNGNGSTFMEVRGVSKRYHIGGGLAGLVRGEKPQTVYAVNEISFTLKRGESLGLAGESGCGKSTTGRLLVKLLNPSEGQIVFDGRDFSAMSGEDLKDFRRRVQLMFQNPFEALNPRFTLYRSLSEPLLIHGWKDERARQARILE
ncbi:MAG: ABC transporter ATP-binding protein, partial [Anaerolineae bacterium]|nr:ABC transporter ATP-binding protein [Anaerolineae bacterium]